VKEAEVDAMVRRILRSYFAKGVMDNPVQPGRTPDLASGAAVTRDAATKSIVLLRNSRSLLPLAPSVRRIAVIGGNADLGVLSGGGSSQVKPANVELLPPPSYAPSFIRNIYLHPSRPLDAIKAAAPFADVTYSNGGDVLAAANMASAAEVAIVIATQFTTEGMDAAMALDGNQDALIAAVARANPNTIVVLQTGGAVKMPWLGDVAGVLATWYPGSQGGEALADVLFGKASPSGRLPITFPADESQLPNPLLPGSLLPRPDTIASSQPEPFTVTYPEGADVGYRWFERRGQQPLFPFGYGLTYTSFVHDIVGFDPAAFAATISVTNTGTREGTDTPQLYLAPPGGAQRLVGWAKAKVSPGQTRSYTIGFDPRFAARFDTATKQWVVPAGTYRLRIAASATDPGVVTTFELREVRLAVNWQPQDALAPVAVDN
jgi:beta-glucosidase